MATDAEDARATLGICALVGIVLAGTGAALVAVAGSDGERGAVSVLGLAALALGGLLLLVAATGWAVSLGVRAAAHGREGTDVG